MLDILQIYTILPLPIQIKKQAKRVSCMPPDSSIYPAPLLAFLSPGYYLRSQPSCLIAASLLPLRFCGHSACGLQTKAFHRIWTCRGCEAWGDTKGSVTFIGGCPRCSTAGCCLQEVACSQSLQLLQLVVVVGNLWPLTQYDDAGLLLRTSSLTR